LLIAAAATVFAGCGHFFADQIPSITFRGARYFSHWTAGMRIAPDDLQIVGTADGVASGDVVGNTVVALQGVSPDDAVVMPTRPGTGVAYLLFVREDVLRGPDGNPLPMGSVIGICRYFIRPAAEGC
jgi:hypothetical protein